MATKQAIVNQGPVVQSVVSLTSSLRVISLTVLADSIYNFLKLFAEKMCKSYSHFFSKKFQNICVSLDVNFNKSLTNDVVSFEQLGPELFGIGSRLWVIMLDGLSGDQDRRKQVCTNASNTGTGISRPGEN